MTKGLGHLIRWIFGGRRPGAAPAPGAGPRDLVEAPLASGDLLRRAMEAASRTTAEPASPATEVQMGSGLGENGAMVPIPTFLAAGRPQPASARTEPSGAVPDLPPRIADTTWFAAAFVDEPAPAVQPEPAGSGDDIWILTEASIIREDEPLPVAPEEVSSTLQSEPEPAPEVGGNEDLALATVSLVSDEVVPACDMPAPEPEPVASPAEVEPEVAAAPTTDASKPRKRAPARKAAPKKPAPKKVKVAAASKASAPEMPVDLVFLSDAVVWTLTGAWREFWLPPTDAATSARLAMFCEHAAAGDLVIWAVSSETADWNPVPVSHWKKAGIDPLSFLAGRENITSESVVSARSRKPPVTYRALRVSRDTVEALWPAARGSSIRAA